MGFNSLSCRKFHSNLPHSNNFYYTCKHFTEVQGSRPLGNPTFRGQNMKTVMVNPSKVERRWKIVDAEGKVLGRVASEVARVLMGKHKATFSPNVDTGDFVIVINADKVVLTGNKVNSKEYFYHTGMIGGETWITFKQYMEKEPTFPLETAIWGMLPHSSLGHQMIKKLKIYAGSEHPHASQKPEALAF